MKIRILWAAPYCLHDTSNGAAIYVKTMLEKLAERGFSVYVLAAFTFDSIAGTVLFPELEEQLKSEHAFYCLEENNISYQYQKVASFNVMEMTNKEEREFFVQYKYILAEFKPDILIQYGGGVLEMLLRAEAKRRNILTAFVICNGGYAGYAFPDTDILLNESPGTIAWYKENSKLNLTFTGAFIRKENVIAEEHNPTYITFINPALEKGVSVVAGLILAFKKRMPEQKFLVVNSRGNWEESVLSLGFDLEDFAHVAVSQHVTDMRPLFGMTKVLLAPSLWYENFCRVACEALLNSIPVLCSDSGGLPSTIGEGGIVVPLLPSMQSNYGYILTEEELEPWVEALFEIVGSEESYALYREKAVQAAQVYDIEMNTDRVEGIFRELLTSKRVLYDPRIYIS